MKDKIKRFFVLTMTLLTCIVIMLLADLAIGGILYFITYIIEAEKAIQVFAVVEIILISAQLLLGLILIP